MYKKLARADLQVILCRLLLAQLFALQDDFSAIRHLCCPHCQSCDYMSLSTLAAEQQYSLPFPTDFKMALRLIPLTSM